MLNLSRKWEFLSGIVLLMKTESWVLFTACSGVIGKPLMVKK
jgi:hypothetical protein